MTVACQPSPTTTPIRPGATTLPTRTAGATAAGQITPGEPNVITGRVSTELGAPIANAAMRIVGYTGGAGLGQAFGTVETDDAGMYRADVTAGYYEVLGQGPLLFDGQAYLFDLEPTDGSCEQALSDAGIVKDFVLSLTGLKGCMPGIDPDSYASYHGAAIQLFDRTSGHGSGAVVVYTLTPIGSLADGSEGKTLDLVRTVANLQQSAGPIGESWMLHDIPLARYQLTAAMWEPDGTPVPLLVSTDVDTTPSAEVEVSFAARAVFDVPTVGYSVPQVFIHDAGAG